MGEEENKAGCEMNSPKKIEKPIFLEPFEHKDHVDINLSIGMRKLFEVIDKVNELEKDKNSLLNIVYDMKQAMRSINRHGGINAMIRKLDKLESQPEECKHEWVKEPYLQNGSSYKPNKTVLTCTLCGIYENENNVKGKQIIYTSERDAVGETNVKLQKLEGVRIEGDKDPSIYVAGEVEKKCECSCGHRPHLDDCYLNHCPHKEKYEPKKD